MTRSIRLLRCSDVPDAWASFSGVMFCCNTNEHGAKKGLRAAHYVMCGAPAGFGHAILTHARAHRGNVTWWRLPLAWKTLTANQ